MPSKRVLGGLLAASLAASACSGIIVDPAPDEERTVMLNGRYVKSLTPEPRLNVHYIDFSDMDTLDIPSTEIPLTTKLDDYLYGWRAEFLEELSDPEGFRIEVLKSAEEMGCDSVCLDSLEPHETIQLAVDIVMDRLDYAYVDDRESSFAREHGMFLPKDQYFYLGYGDCDKYTDLTTLAFQILKEENDNPRLQNVHMTEKMGETNHWAFFHTWNTILIMTAPDQVYLSAIDVQDADDGGFLQADSYYIDPVHFEYKFFRDIHDFERALEILDSLLAQAEGSEEQRDLLGQKGSTYYIMGDYLSAGRIFEQRAELPSRYGGDAYLDLERAAENYLKAEAYHDVLRVAEFAKERFSNTSTINAHAIDACFALAEESCSLDICAEWSHDFFCDIE